MTGDFKDEEKGLVGKIGRIINSFQEEVYNLSSKNITISDNLDQEVKILTATVDSAGNPTTNISFKNNLKNKIQGCQVIRAIGSVYPNGHPFISYSETSGIVTINNIKGLPANTQFQLVILLIGQ